MNEEQQRRENELIAETLVGDEAETFKVSELGRCLLGIAEQDRRLALEELETVNPTDVPAIEALQRRAMHARNFEAWIDDLITKGRQALEVLKHESKD